MNGPKGRRGNYQKTGLLLQIEVRSHYGNPHNRHHALWTTGIEARRPRIRNVRHPGSGDTVSRDSSTLLLAVDTSTRFAGVGIDDGSGSVVCRSWRSEQNHGAELMPAIMAMLEESGRTPADITHLAVANGPGGFSALRVGIGVVFGLATPRDLADRRDFDS